jgi:hypothetical protein
MYDKSGRTNFKISQAKMSANPLKHEFTDKPRI